MTGEADLFAAVQRILSKVMGDSVKFPDQAICENRKSNIAPAAGIVLFILKRINIFGSLPCVIDCRL